MPLAHPSRRAVLSGALAGGVLAALPAVPAQPGPEPPEVPPVPHRRGLRTVRHDGWDVRVAGGLLSARGVADTGPHPVTRTCSWRWPDSLGPPYSPRTQRSSVMPRAWIIFVVPSGTK